MTRLLLAFCVAALLVWWVRSRETYYSGGWRCWKENQWR